jgi:hypothetical protein
MPSILSKPVEPIDDNTRDMLVKLVEYVEEFNVSVEEKKECVKKALITLKLKMETGKLAQGVELVLRKTETTLILVDGDFNPVFIHKFESLEKNYVNTPELMEELVKFEKKFIKDQKHPAQAKFNDIGFFKHQQYGIWGNFNAKEWIEDIKCWEKKIGEKMTLKDCDVKTCKISGRKYKRITFTNDKVNQMSHIELCFGTMIDGFSYLILPDAWKKIKDEVMTLVNYETTTYGNKTRWDLSGNEYKAEH